MPEPEPPDAYQTLLVQPTASQEEITTAWRGLVRAVHPDRSSDSRDQERRTAVAAQVNAAYTLLRDPARRAAYDRERLASGDPAAARDSDPQSAPGAMATDAEAQAEDREPPAEAEAASGIALVLGPIVAFGDWLLRDRWGQWIALVLLCLPFGYSVVSRGQLGDIAPMFLAWLLILGFAQVLRVGRFEGTPMGAAARMVMRAARAAWSAIRP